jgi:plasmid stability protein
MASLTVRGLDDDVKRRLRVRAATQGVSLEEEVRRILKGAVAGVQPPTEQGSQPGTGIAPHWVDKITAMADALGGFELDIPPRESGWQPPDFSDFPFDERDDTAGQDPDRR